jgi:hypothetical protein
MSMGRIRLAWFSPRWRFPFVLALLATAAWAGHDPSSSLGHVELRAGNLRLVLADNQAYGEIHRAGYNGVSELEHGDSGRNLFVPRYAGLNLEHIFSGDADSYGRDTFEPRLAPMRLVRVADTRYDLRQNRTESWPLLTTMTFSLAPPDAIDLKVRCVPLADAWSKHGYIGLFFASYIDAPEDLAIHFIGRSRPGEGDPAPRWIRHLPTAHGEAACHRPAGSDWDPPLDPGLPIVLVSGVSPYEYLYPFYYGVSHGKVLILMFERRTGDELRFAQSPSGGGDGNPAWDFIFLKQGYRVGEMFHFRMRAVYRDFRGVEDVVRTYEAWSGKRVERPASERSRRFQGGGRVSG